MHKNQLQEFCQKNNLELPKYVTNLSKKSNMFKSEVTIVYNNKKHQCIGYGTKKKEAEKDGAKIMMGMVRTIRNDEIKNYKSDKDIYILFDLENIHVGDFFEQKRFDNRFHFMGFATENHSTIEKAPSELQIRTIKSDRRDAADTLMIGYTAVLIDSINISSVNDISMHEIIIVTKDHFGPGLVDYIYTINPKINAITIKTIPELTYYLNK